MTDIHAYDRAIYDALRGALHDHGFNIVLLDLDLPRRGRPWKANKHHGYGR